MNHKVGDKGSQIYPKTYEECCEIVKVGKEHTLEGITIQINYRIALLESIQKLLICRDAYWRIAGEEMGLWKSWKPDYYSLKTKYTIVVVENKVVKLDTLSQNHILTFPTEEMRDAFYEAFKELIEECKELL